MPCCQLFAAGSDTYTSYGYCETIMPDSGYQMAEGSLTYSLAVAGGETVKITGNRFTMPAGNVTITCKWETATTTVKGITSFSINGVAGAVNNSTNNWKRSAIIGFGMSALIELAQYFIMRNVAVDDIILNTAGAICGYLLYLFIRKHWTNFTDGFLCREVSKG